MSRINLEDNNANTTRVASSGGIGFCGLLTIVFIVLKLCKVISWNWFWVFSPLIFGTALSIIFIVVAAIIYIKLTKDEN